MIICNPKFVISLCRAKINSLAFFTFKKPSVLSGDQDKREHGLSQSNVEQVVKNNSKNN